MKQITVVVFGGSGGPLDDSIPSYSTKKGPADAWCYEADGKTQHMIKNGTELIMIDPVSCTMDQLKLFFSLKDNGDYNYARVWYIAADGTGIDWFGQPVWVEYSHLTWLKPDEPPPDPEPTGTTKKFKLVSFDFASGVIEVEEV